MSALTFGSACSGIEAASVAWEPLGWRCIWIAEIEKFPNAVTGHHWPQVPNLGDMTLIAARIRSGEVAPPDILVAGTPCQAFSVAGLRLGLSDPRGRITIAFMELADAIDAARSLLGLPPCIIVWENVPGVLNHKDNPFGCFLGGLAGENEELQPPGGKWTNAGCVFGPQRAIAWRTIDAQYFRLAQRRRRVFVVASARNGFDPTAVLFEFEGLRRDSPPRRETGQGAAHDVAPCLTSGGRGVERTGETRGQDPVGAVMDDSHLQVATGTLQANGKAAGSATQQDAESGMLVPVAFGGNNTSGPIDITPALLAQPGSGWKGDFDSETFCVTGQVTHTLKADGFDGSEDGTGRGNPIVPVALRDSGEPDDNRADVACSSNVLFEPLPFDTTQITSKTNRCQPKHGDPCHPLVAGGHAPAIAFDVKGGLAPHRSPAVSDTAFPIKASDHKDPQVVAYRTSGNCGAYETGDRTDALTTGTDPSGHVIVEQAPVANVSHTLRTNHRNNSNPGTEAQMFVVCFSSKDHGADASADVAPTLRAGGHNESHANAGVPPAIAFRITPSNSNKDYNAREADYAQALTANGGPPSARGGDLIIEPTAVYPILEVGARTGVSTTDARAGCGIAEDGDPMFTLQAGKQHGIAFALRGREDGAQPEVHGDGDSVGALRAASGGSSRDYVAGVMQAIKWAVRRLTPTECERLQGFPDGHTLIPWRGKPASECPDGPRYKALGNSMAVPVMRWIGERLALYLADGDPS